MLGPLTSLRYSGSTTSISSVRYLIRRLKLYRVRAFTFILLTKRIRLRWTDRGSQTGAPTLNWMVVFWFCHFVFAQIGCFIMHAHMGKTAIWEAVQNEHISLHTNISTSDALLVFGYARICVRYYLGHTRPWPTCFPSTCLPSTFPHLLLMLHQQVASLSQCYLVQYPPPDLIFLEHWEE